MSGDEVREAAERYFRESCGARWKALFEGKKYESSVVAAIEHALRRDREERHLDRPLEQCPKCYCMIRPMEKRDDLEAMLVKLMKMNQNGLGFAYLRFGEDGFSVVMPSDPRAIEIGPFDTPSAAVEAAVREMEGKEKGKECGA